MTKTLLAGIVDYTVRTSGAQTKAEQEAAIDALVLCPWVRAGAEMGFALLFSHKQNAECTAFAYAFSSAGSYILQMVEDLFSRPEVKGRHQEALNILKATANVDMTVAALKAVQAKATKY
jgi:hypothetical protein